MVAPFATSENSPAKQTIVIRKKCIPNQATQTRFEIISEHFTEDNEGNEDFLRIILSTSSLSLFSSVSLFVLIDAGKNDAFVGGACWHQHPRHAVPVVEGRLPMGHWLGNQCRSTQNRQSRDFSGPAVLIR